MVSINGSHLVEALINGSSSTWGSINGYIVSSRDGGGGERGGEEDLVRMVCVLVWVRTYINHLSYCIHPHTSSNITIIIIMYT